MVASLLPAVPEEFLDADDRTPVALRGLLMPKLVDVRTGTVVLDDRHTHKRPDWTYDN